jgi:hypothetical protein
MADVDIFCVVNDRGIYLLIDIVTACHWGTNDLRPLGRECGVTFLRRLFPQGQQQAKSEHANSAKDPLIPIHAPILPFPLRDQQYCGYIVRKFGFL